jgi:ribosomal protein S27E
MLEELFESNNNLTFVICTCIKCKNEFLVYHRPEFSPSYCCYCGLRFRFYKENGKTKNLAGQEIDDE